MIYETRKDGENKRLEGKIAHGQWIDGLTHCNLSIVESKVYEYLYARIYLFLARVLSNGKNSLFK